MADEVRIEGWAEFKAQLEKLGNQLSNDKVEPVLKEGAQIISNDARGRAPRGPTGNLKRGIIAKFLTQSGNNPRSALAGVDYKIAPHAHFLERGTSKMSARPFFRPAVDANMGRVHDMVISKLKSLVEAVAR